MEFQPDVRERGQHKGMHMDRFVFEICFGVAALSFLDPDWKESPVSAWVQVATMASCVGFLLTYVLLR